MKVYVLDLREKTEVEGEEWTRSDFVPLFACTLEDV